jgi:hypothetical protein
VFALGLSVVYVLFSNYEEVRAHMVVLVLVLPSALISVRNFLNHEESVIHLRSANPLVRS